MAEAPPGPFTLNSGKSWQKLIKGNAMANSAIFTE